MPHAVLQLSALPSPHDAGIRQIAALSARIAYVLVCLSVCWGVLVNTGWVHRLSGREATRSSHMVLATLALAFGGMHALAFLFLTGDRWDLLRLTVPMLHDGLLRHAAGIVGFEVLLAVAVSSAFRRFIPYRRWLALHRFAYPAVVLLLAHSVYGAIANGHLNALWLGGLTVLVPTVVLVALRLVPPRALTGLGMVEEDV